MNNSFPPFTQDMFEQILYNSPEPLLITDKGLDIVYVNHAWEKLTGYALNDVLGKNPRMLHSGKTPQKVLKKMSGVLADGKSFATDLLINKKKNGNEYHVLSTIYPVVKNGEPFYYVQIQQDITKEKRLSELRKEFLSASAHELKTPITVLKLLTQSHLYKVKDQDNDCIKVGELELMDKELDSLTRLVNDILDTSRAETGKLYLRTKQINLVTLIDDLLEKVKLVAKSHQIVFTKPSEDCFVLADSERIEQVLLNLISNAVKYSQEKTTISITVTKNNTTAVVSVSDHGIGIPKGKLRLIFDRYYQVKVKDNKGFGLGLYISHEIIKHHKGKIWVESQVGKGSTFYFSLPLLRNSLGDDL